MVKAISKSMKDNMDQLAEIQKNIEHELLARSSSPMQMTKNQIMAIESNICSLKRQIYLLEEEKNLQTKLNSILLKRNGDAFEVLQ